MLDAARRLVRLSGGLIRGLHRGAWDEAAAREAETQAERLRTLAKRRPEFALHGAALQAFGEYTEAYLLRALLRRKRPPGPQALQVPPAGYVLGLGDLVGEARRTALDALGRGATADAQWAFEQMEKVYEALLAYELPEGLVSVRPKVDTARALLEKTRGDLVNAKRSKELEKKIDGIRSLLDEAEGAPAAKRRRKSAPVDLDLDKAWDRS